ncbi:hypothetical protein IFVP177_C140279 [Vibrio parahaemolyticus]
MATASNFGNSHCFNLSLWGKPTLDFANLDSLFISIGKVTVCLTKIAISM